MNKIAIFTFWLTISGFACANEINADYQNVLNKYAEAALAEFDLVESQSLSKGISGSSSTISTGKDKVGRTFFVVLYPSGKGCVYVALELSKDGYLEIHSRGGLSVTPKDFAGNFDAHISKIVHYPDAT
ncbi:hypothetical protein [Neptunomonas sp.]|uniref:hypothetical protein n=1 Tax=Neptunomonas sp. TaxID=1971898 RepID=UPI0035620122